MFRVLGSAKRLCSGLNRRDFLQAGGLGAGLTLSSLINRQLEAEPSESSIAQFGKAKRCILLFLYGSPSQLETFDMKPQAPAEIRGEMKPISSSLPGLDVCEYMPHLAKVMDKMTVVRSVTHPHPIHGVAYAMTGIPSVDVAMELNPFDPAHHPWFGSVVEYHDRLRRGLPTDGTIQNVGLPFPFSSQRSDQPLRAGPYGAFLGSSLNPMWTEFVGKGTKPLKKDRGGGFNWEGMEPYLGCTDDTHFRVATTAPLPQMTLDRLDRRKSLLTQFDDSLRHLDQSPAGRSLGRFQEMAFSLVSSSKVRDALDVRQESNESRDLYGRTLFGQGCLAARRLLEAGTKLVTVFWDEYGLAGDAWDTHFSHLERMRDQLLPPWDRALSGLLIDLDRRGMLDDTLVACLSEHGRTPKLNARASRDHWSRAYSACFAGGGMARGRVVGATDSHAGDVVDNPVSPKDLLATMYHLLGIDPHGHIPRPDGQSVPMLPEESRVVSEMFA